MRLQFLAGSPALRSLSRAGRTFLLLAAVSTVVAACGASSTKGTLTGVTPPIEPAPTPSITLSPASAAAHVGGQVVSFTASVSGGASTALTWQVNGVAGGDSTVGTVSETGQYQSPAVMPSPATVTVTAVAAANSVESGSASVALTAGAAISVTVSPSSATVLAGGGSQSFVASLSNATNAAVAWSVNGVVGGNAVVGTISATGLFTAPAAPPAEPTVTITAVSVQDPTQSAAASVLVTSTPPPILVTVSPSAAILQAGTGTLTFTATVLNGPGAVSWQVNGVAGGNATVGTITTTGRYTAPAKLPSPASVNVSAVSVADPTKSGSASVTITTVGSVSLSPAGANVQAGIGTQPFIATVTNETNTSLTWAVNGITGGNSTVGTISSTGLYTAPADAPTPAAVTVTAVLVADTLKSAAATVTITPRISVLLSPASATAQAGGGTQTFVPTISNTSNQGLVWKVNGVIGGNATVGTVSTAGAYTAPASVPSPATVTVTAASVLDAGRPGTSFVTVTAGIAVTVSPATANVRAGGTQALTVAVTNTSNLNVTWQVNGIAGGNATVGAVSAAGLYTAPVSIPSPATVTVTAVSVADPTRSGSAALTISAATSVSVTPASASLQAGTGSQAFTATVSNASNTAVTWQVNGVVGGNASVGTISSAGLYLAPASVPSPAAVTVMAVSVADTTRSAAATVTVTAAVSVSVSPSIASVSAGGSTLQLTATVTHGATGAVTWKVNGTNGGNASVGWISAAGFYTSPATAPSPATVTVSAVSTDDISKSASASVTVVAAAVLPTISGSPAATATVGQAYSFAPSATGASGLTLTFAIANKPSWATFSTSTGRLTGTPAAGAVGTYSNISISVGDGTNTATLPAFTITVAAGAVGSATLSWTAPTTRADGSALTNLAGFDLYWGTTVGTYPNVRQITSSSTVDDVISNLGGGTWYFVVTALDANGVESDYSNVASKTIQ